MLKPCPECKREISDKAPVCPHCGVPITAQPGTQTNPVTTQQTAQLWKGMQLIGCTSCIIAILLCIPFPTFGIIAGFLGFFLFAYGRMKAWWHHG